MKFTKIILAISTLMVAAISMMLYSTQSDAREFKFVTVKTEVVIPDGGGKLIMGGNVFAIGRIGVAVPPQQHSHSHSTKKPTKTANQKSPAWVKQLKPGQFVIETRDGSRLIGSIAGQDALPVQTEFGQVALPLAGLGSVEAGAQNGPSKIRFRNGDSLTVTLKIGSVHLQTQFGAVEVQLADILRITAGDQYTPTYAQLASSKKSSGGSTKSTKARIGINRVRMQQIRALPR